MMDPLIEGYLSYLAHVARKAPGTVKDVACTLRHAVAVMGELRPGVALWRCSLEDWLRLLEHDRRAGRKPSVLAKDLSHLRGLLNYAWRSGRADRNVLDGFSLNDDAPRSEPRSLTLEEAAQMVGACKARNLRDRRDRLIVLLLYGCGLRTGELCALDIPDVERERQELLVRRAKNDRPRVVPIPDGVYTELLAHLLDSNRNGALFRMGKGRRRVNQKDVGEVVGCAARLAGLVGVTPRTLRHTFATHLMDRGVDLAVIASLMGHRSPGETGVYLHVLPGKREAAVRSLPAGVSP